MNGISTKEEEIDKKEHQSQYSIQYLLYEIWYICCSHSEAYIMLTLSKKEEQQRQQQAKNGYWQNELLSLGIVDPKEKKEFNDKEENENLSDIIKQAMFQDYKLAYSEKGDAHTEEANSTVTVG